MTKGIQPQSEGINIEKADLVATSQDSCQLVVTSSQQKCSKKHKRASSIFSKPGNGGKKKKSLKSQKSNHSAPPLAILQNKLANNLAILVPLLKRSCPDNSLFIESIKGSNQTKESPLSKTGEAAKVNSPNSSNSQESSIKSQNTPKQKKRKHGNYIAGIASSSNLLLRRVNEYSLNKNRSSPSLALNLKKEKTSSDPASFPSSRTLASEFPEVVRFYENALALEKKNTASVKLSHSSSAGSALLAHLGKPSLFSFQHKRGSSSSPYLKVSSSSGNSTPSTPSKVKSISVKLQKPSPPAIHHQLFSLATGWGASPRSAPAIPFTNSHRGLGKHKLPYQNPVIKAAETGSDSALPSSVPPSAPHTSNASLLDPEALQILATIDKTMNAKSNSSTNFNSGKSQYPSVRSNQKMQNQISSSFCLPYGMRKNVQSLAVNNNNNNTVPSSSSFQCGPLESLQLMSEHHQKRQQNQLTNNSIQQRKFLERQKMKMLKPLSVSRNQSSITKLYDIPTSEFSASILPDTGTTSYRLTHDVSFDEGSRYRTTGDYPHSLKKSDDVKGSHITTNGVTNQFAATSSTRANGSYGSSMRHEGRSSSRKEQIVPLKETVPLSLVRLEERFGSDIPTAASPSSPALSSTIAATTTASTFMPPPSASRSQNPSSVTSGGNAITTFRFHKEKHNWNYRLGELSINGGGYYSSSTLQPNGRQEINPSISVHSSSANHQSLQTRERTALGTKSRMSSRYSSKNDSGNTNSSFSDPCISAPASFQQRLTDLSILESETIKYERNRKLRRKKNQDKDS